MKKIFIVEDDYHLQNLYKILLSQHNYNVIGTANNGDQAILTFKTFIEKPSVIIMDYRIPKKNGIKTMKEILEIDHKVKVIIITGDKL